MDVKMMIKLYKGGEKMINWGGKLRNITIIVMLITMLCFLGIDGQDVSEPVEPEVKEVVAPIPEKTNLDVLLIDKINGSAIQMSNCKVALMGKMKIAEDTFDYNNTFFLGDMYEITIMLERKD